jgi:type III secretion protein W
MPPDIPNINLAALEAKAAMREAKQLLVKQVSAAARFTEDVETQGFNPVAAGREQARLNQFRSLENRKPTQAEGGAKKRVEATTESREDLADQFHDRNPELPPNKLRDLRNRLHANQTVEETLEAVQSEEFFPDPTLADEALEYLERETEGSLQATIRQARILLNEQKGREIIAGRNVDMVAKSFYKKGIGSSATQLRDLYRDITGNPREHNVLFEELSQRYEFDQLKLVIAFLLKGLAYDSKSKGPSIQQAELIRLMTDTRNLQSILWVYFFFRSRLKLIRSLYKRYGRAYSKSLTFEKLAREFISIVEERYPSIMKILKHLERIEVIDEFEQMIILSQYRDAVREVAPRIYKSVRHRQDLFSMIVESLTELEGKLEEKQE